MNDALFHGIAIIALLVSNTMLVALGFVAARLYFTGSEANPEQEGLSSLHQDLKGVTLSLAALGERLAKLEIQISQLREHSEQQGLPLNREADQKSFKIATKLALQGAKVEEIVELCGLTRGEAELIRMLHASNQVSPSSVAGGPIPIPKLASRVTALRSSGNLDPDQPDITPDLNSPT